MISGMISIELKANIKTVFVKGFFVNLENS